MNKGTRIKDQVFLLKYQGRHPVFSDNHQEIPAERIEVISKVRIERKAAPYCPNNLLDS